MSRSLPSGTVTFLFTDVEGSTWLLHELGAQAYADALAEHRRVIREACASEGGVEVDTQGDAFFFSFATAPGALAAAAAFTEALASGPISVRVGLHTGTPLLTEEGYVGADVNRAARIAACGHGGQVLVSASTAQLVEGALRDLGEHRLKDLSAAERVFQLGEADFPPLTSLYRTNLPIPATPFLGREQELADVVELLSDSRLLTLTGPGGTGKTRLALQAAAEAAESFPDGVYWIPLAPLRDHELVLATASETLGSKNGLAEHIQDKSMLCLFDNFEQVVEAAPDLAELLSACPNLDVLVTSRERLRVGGEQTYPVPPLAESDGEALFLTRARAVDPAFTPTEAVRELCQRLDELPLAIELAAARTAIFSTEQLLERLSQRLDLLKGERDADPRQQTLRATIAWSHDLLSEDEQRLFARLSVFSGGCTYEAAEEIAGADPDTLQSLLDKSLLRKRESDSGPRYWMLETIREFATERLTESGEAEGLRRRHAEHFLAFVEEVEPRALLGSPHEKELLDRIARERDNLRATLDQLEAEGDGELVLRVAGAMWPLWAFRGPIGEGQRRLEHALAFGGGTAAARANALTGLLSTGELTGEALRARAEEELVLYRELGDAWGAAHAVFMLGFAAAEQENDEIARQRWEEALGGFQGVGDEHFATVTRDCLAWVYAELGDRRRAIALNEDNLRRARESSNRRVEAFALDRMAMVTLDEGRVDEAVALLRESMALYRDLEIPSEAAECLCYVAATEAAAGQPERAASFLSTALSRFDELGATVPFWVARRNERTLAAVRGQLGDSAFAAAWEEGTRMSLDDAIELALAEAEPDA